MSSNTEYFIKWPDQQASINSGRAFFFFPGAVNWDPYPKPGGWGLIKKLWTAACFALLPVFTVFGADFSLSLGGGGLLGGLFTRYTLAAEGTVAGTPVDILSKQEVNQFNYGAYLLFDATWVEFSVSLQGGTGTYREDMSAESSPEETVFGADGQGAGSEIMTGLALLGKYPFRLSRQLAIFPLAGIECQIALREHREPEEFQGYDRTDGIRESDSNGNAYRLSAWNSFFIDIGAGLDFKLNSRLFLRAELLYAFRLMTPFEADALEKVKKMTNAPDPKLSGLASGPTLRFGLGYTL
jgi:opacity protein-like surface antigen